MLVMGKLNNNIIKAVLLLTVFLPLSTNSLAADDETQAVKTNSPFNIIDAAKRLYSLPTTSDSGAGSWMSFQSPHLDFKGGDKVEDEEEAAVRVKDAVVKSLDKSRETIEDSAKSAARFVLDKTVNKLKTTPSQQDYQTEL